MEYPKTLEEARKLRYGQWSGDPKGHKYDDVFCAYEVLGESGFGLPYQCQRKNGHGPSGLYCKQHAKIVAKYLERHENG